MARSCFVGCSPGSPLPGPESTAEDCRGYKKILASELRHPTPDTPLLRGKLTSDSR